MKAHLVILSLVLSSFFQLAISGVGSGGGGDEREKNLVARFDEVIKRVKSLNPSDDIKTMVAAIEKTLKESPLEIIFTEKLTYCHNGLEIQERKDAWGCPGKLQIRKNFPIKSDALIFHELTRITPGYEKVDENHKVSITKLKLNISSYSSIRIEEYYPKIRNSLATVKGWAKTMIKAGADATGIKETNENYILISYWPPVGVQINTAIIQR